MTKTTKTTKAKEAAPAADPITEGVERQGSTPAPAPDAEPASPKGKIGAVIALLRRPEGARIEDLMAATGWQSHSVRGAMAGAIKKKLGLTIASVKTDGVRTYRIEGPAA
jgi:Protein of unknown function (DUF3489)